MIPIEVPILLFAILRYSSVVYSSYKSIVVVMVDRDFLQVSTAIYLNQIETQKLMRRYFRARGGRLDEGD